jgi:hypothetical protein
MLGAGGAQLTASRRRAGGHYLVGTGSVGSDEPARKTESDVRAAAFILSGR